MQGIEIIPTNTCPPDLVELARRSELFAEFAPQVHLDIDDAKFAPVLSWPYFSGQWGERAQPLPLADSLRYETHLMVHDPLEIGESLARAGCFRIVPHIEVFSSDDAIRSAFSMWKSAGASEVGLAVLIDTPLSTLEQVIQECDSVLLMSIATLGSQGAPFDSRIFGRVQELHTTYPDLLIAVDGGVGESNIARLVAVGARCFCVGSAISKSPDPASTYRSLLSLAGGVE